ncbi:MAG TPA: cupredoxin family copper-binding protein [Candidatus Nanoarchaeia archaeon]|nr:cupredoxin family copper-binding protein [Candidatus Nanoarchaeia archaeon]
MKKIILIFVILAGLFVAGCSQDKNLGETQNTIAIAVNDGNTAVISGFAFNPGEITIKAGDKITWINNDDVKHTVTSDSGVELKSGLFGNGEKYEHVFNAVGEYSYYCEPHPNMKGKVIVVGN